MEEALGEHLVMQLVAHELWLAYGGAGVLWWPPARLLGYRGRKEEEAYCYRAGGGQLGGAMAFSGWVGG